LESLPAELTDALDVQLVLTQVGPDLLPSDC
jgi:hypothetical protein